MRVEGPRLFSSEAKAQTFARDLAADWAFEQLGARPELAAHYIDESGELIGDPLALLKSKLNDFFSIYVQYSIEKLPIDDTCTARPTNVRSGQSD